MGGLDTGMTAADDNDIKLRMFHVKHLLSDAEAREYLVQKMLDIHMPDESLQRANSAPDVLRDQLCKFRGAL